ncbi:AMP-binding protein [Phenylobacterium koreense]|uniref:Long-chain acyl-CoA synthetase n=1 Tax=Phenylobacterium koreense TaxID=266125 RepID=A0ABV2ENF1_9CAUL
MDGSQQQLDLAERVTRAIGFGMMHAVWAEVQPDKVAIFDPDGRTRTFGQLNANANRIARLLREAGLKPGEGVALLCTNRAEFAEVMSGAMRVGLRLTPINWHMTAEEIAYVIKDCEAKALFADAAVATAREAAASCPDLRLKVAIGGAIGGFADYDATLGQMDATDIPDPLRGYTMLYTSGTTGRPKGVYKPSHPGPAYSHDYDREHDLHMCLGPAYHAAPLMGDVRRPLLNGVPLVFMDKWDSEKVLRTIAEKKVTNAHFVAIMFQRLLALPDAVKRSYDVSSMKTVSHGAAPCPPEVKRAMIEWFGPVLSEYYAGSEGGAGFIIKSEEWLRKPGSVGRRPSKDAAIILDEEGNECPPNVPGAIYMKVPAEGFEYFKDPGKTQGSRKGGLFTMGDIGYLDEDDYLFLTGRSAETIISGGVNIYPQEVDNELIKHPAIEDACTVGAPNDEWGEEVVSVIQLKAGHEPSEKLADEILAHARAALARYKQPRRLEFVEALPRSEAGKILRNRVRAPFWEGRARQI